ncbi:hypothetical protein OG411_19205 [Streptomyces pseudogriseolus]|uniref:hypothetical protein n=1 Tax=Streptomyces pseudogriseolus TaxID=36817 RepID=UPI0032530190
MTRRFAHVLATGYALTALALMHMAVVSWRAGSWPYAAFLAGASLLLMTAVVHHSWQSGELRDALERLEEAARPPAIPAAVADEIALGWQALAETCCLTAWESRGARHDRTTCTRKENPR